MSLHLHREGEHAYGRVHLAWAACMAARMREIFRDDAITTGLSRLETLSALGGAPTGASLVTTSGCYGGAMREVGATGRGVGCGATRPPSCCGGVGFAGLDGRSGGGRRRFGRPGCGGAGGGQGSFMGAACAESRPGELSRHSTPEAVGALRGVGGRRCRQPTGGCARGRGGGCGAGGVPHATLDLLRGCGGGDLVGVGAGFELWLGVCQIPHVRPRLLHRACPHPTRSRRVRLWSRTGVREWPRVSGVCGGWRFTFPHSAHSGSMEWPLIGSRETERKLHASPC